MTLSFCKNRIAVALSGGVDSSVAAFLLAQQLSSRSHQQQNGSLIGLFMNNWSDDGESATSYCVHTEKDFKDAEAVCSMLDMPLYRGNFSSEYWTEVFDPFLEGIIDTTPNPDMLCNSKIKFGTMKDYALHRYRASCIATGHYARLWRRQKEEWMDEWTDDVRKGNNCSNGNPLQTLEEEIYSTGKVPNWIDSWGKSTSSKNPTSPLLVVGADLSKDQSYFLSMTPGIAFKNVLFPLGYLKKTSESSQNANTMDDRVLLSVRDIAAQAGLKTARKKDSSGICFIGKRCFPEFIFEFLPLAAQQEGDFVCVDTGKIVGTHKGCAVYTIGQGAKISGALQKWFVTGKDPLNSVVYVCSGTHHPSLYTHELYMDSTKFNWIGGDLPPPLLQQSEDDASLLQGISCRTRHLQPLAECEVSYNANAKRLRVIFQRPIRAVTPGQTAALYTAGGLICLGGGPIQSRGPSYHEMGKPLPLILHPSGHNDISLIRSSCSNIQN